MSNTSILKDLTNKIGSGSTPRGGDKAYHNEGISFIRSQNVLDLTFSSEGLAHINEEQAAALDGVRVFENDILINITGDSIARTCIVPKHVLPARVSQHVAIVRSIDSNKSRYISYYLHYLKPYLLKICGVGGTRNALTKDALEQLRITIQENPEKIATVLSTLDAKIVLNNRINTELESMTKTLYDYWFVQFDFPDKNGKPYKFSGGKMIWNEELKRKIPEGWTVKRIGEVAAVKAGGDKPDIFSTFKTDICSVPIYSNGIDTDGLYGYTNEATITMQSVTISARGTIGYTVLRHKPFVPIIRLIVVTPYDSGVAHYFKEYIKGINFGKNGSIQQQLTVPHVSSINILWPSMQILHRFESVVSVATKYTETIEKETQQIAELRDWLLPMLMNGQVKVN